MHATPVERERGRPARIRAGFTLVELLVAIGIMLLLVGLALVFANSGVIGNHKLKGGSDRVAGWLLQARARAQREGAPRGVRFIPDASGVIREAQLIEVPDPITPPSTFQVAQIVPARRERIPIRHPRVNQRRPHLRRPHEQEPVRPQSPRPIAHAAASCPTAPGTGGTVLSTRWLVNGLSIASSSNRTA